MSTAIHPEVVVVPAKGRRQLGLSRDDWIARAVLLALMAFLVVFLLAPMLAIFVRAVQDEQGNFIGLTHFTDYLQSPALLQSAWNSVWVAATVAGISVPLAFLFAYA